MGGRAGSMRICCDQSEILTTRRPDDVIITIRRSDFGLVWRWLWLLPGERLSEVAGLRPRVFYVVVASPGAPCRRHDDIIIVYPLLSKTNRRVSVRKTRTVSTLPIASSRETRVYYYVSREKSDVIVLYSRLQTRRNLRQASPVRTKRKKI